MDQQPQDIKVMFFASTLGKDKKGGDKIWLAQSSEETDKLIDVLSYMRSQGKQVTFSVHVYDKKDKPGKYAQMFVQENTKPTQPRQTPSRQEQAPNARYAAPTTSSPVGQFRSNYQKRI